MRIALFSDTSLPRINGISYVLEITRRELVKMGHEVHVFVPATGLSKREDGDPPHMHRFPGIEGLFVSEQSTSVFFPPVTLKKIKDYNFDIIHIFTPAQLGLLGSYAAVHFDIPLISQYCTDMYQYAQQYKSALPGTIMLALTSPVVLKLKPKEIRHAAKVMKPRRSVGAWQKNIVRCLHELLHARCDAVIAPSTKMAKVLKRWNPSANIVILPNGVDQIIPSSTRAVAEFREKHAITDEDQVMLYVGRITQEKNLDLLIDSFKYVVRKNRHAKLILVGAGIYEEQLQERALKNGIAGRIVFAGRLPRENLGAVYETADVFVFPSLTDTQGLVVNEAAAAGLPSVLCDPEISEVFVPGKTGLLAASRPKAFAQAVLKLLADKERCQSLGRAAKQKAAEYNELEQSKKLVSLYESVIADHYLK